MSSNSMNLQNKLEGDELDLSMMRLTDIPITEIAAIPKATQIDLSNNELVVVSPNFAKSLSHITKLDLSSNQLRGLPKNFGNLVNLKHLDLYSNQLTDLPVSLSIIQTLRYIDVKNNPLRPDLAKAAGNCLNSKECQVAAKNLLFHLAKLRSEKDREKSAKALQERELEMAKRRQEEEEEKREREKKKAEKKIAKEKKRMEIERAERASIKQNGNKKESGVKKENNEKRPSGGGKEVVKMPKKGGAESKGKGRWSCLGLLNIFLLFGVLITAGFCATLYVEGDLSVEGMKAAWPRVKRNTLSLWSMTKETLKYDNLKTTAETSWKTIGPFMLRIKEVLILSYAAVKNLSTSAFVALQSVTGDLTPYLDGVKPLWERCCANVVWFSGIAIDWIRSLDLCCVIKGVQNTGLFLADQVRVINAEFWSNEAVVNAWKDMKPFRQSVWTNTESVRHLFANVCSDLQTYWLPLIQQETYNLYVYGKHNIESLMT